MTGDENACSLQADFHLGFPAALGSCYEEVLDKMLVLEVTLSRWLILAIN